MKNITKVQRITISSLLASFSILLSQISRYLSIPGLPMLKFDFSDIPIFVSTLIFDQFHGYLIIFVVSIIKYTLFSSVGWMGFIMRMISVVPIFFLNMYNKKKKNIILYSFLSIIFSLLIKIPMNYILWINFFSMNLDQVNSMMKIILPYNIIKYIINIYISVLLSNKLKNIMDKNEKF